MSDFLENFKLQLRFLFSRLWDQPQNFLEIIILATIIYYIILFIRGTRTIAVLRGALLLAALYGLAKYLNFDTININYTNEYDTITVCNIKHFFNYTWGKINENFIKLKMNRAILLYLYGGGIP